MKKVWKQWQWVLLLLVICTYSCKDEKESSEPQPFDPSKEVVIKSFTPDGGGAYQQLLITGENFGTDPSIVTVTVGGQKAVLISVTGSYIHCFVPSKAFSGIIEVSVGTADAVKTVTATKPFSYKKEMVLGTLCGYRNQSDDQGWRTGSFATCSGFRKEGMLAFDPTNKSHLYIGYDGEYGFIQLIDLEKREVKDAFNVYAFGLNNRIRSIDFTKASPKYDKAEGQYMVVTLDENTGDTTPNVFLIERNANGTFDANCNKFTLASFKQCNGASVHPNGEIYFNSYDLGQVFRVDPEDFYANPAAWNPNQVQNKEKIPQLFTIADPSWESKIFIHPTGTYAYIVVINRNYILRTDYNSETKRFVSPYIVAGKNEDKNDRDRTPYKDDVGADARFTTPYQGVFVKNPDYTTGDLYDFYFADRGNHCIRKMTPDGVVSTYAGRGTASASDGNQWGANDGNLRLTARFRDPSGLAYDKDNNIFYVHDEVNRKIRTIAMDSDE